MDRFVTRTRELGLVVAILAVIPFAGVAAQATPEASPAASPVAVAGAGCEGLSAYFQELAGLTLDHDGLVILRDAGYDVQTLTADQAAAVVRSLDTLIPMLQAITPLVPAPAAAYHAAYLEMMAWYRALAAYRDEASYQQLINDDRRLFALMGLAIQSGQAACGYEVWNDARDAAFAPED